LMSKKQKVDDEENQALATQVKKRNEKEKKKQHAHAADAKEHSKASKRFAYQVYIFCCCLRKYCT
jgi:single-stranded DNA-specific DHH superfamily exonuclease